MQRALQLYVRKLVPARLRARLAAYTETRCDPLSQCTRQASELLALLFRHSRGAATDMESDVVIAACIVLLDGPQRALSTRRTDGPALETLKEAFFQVHELGGLHNVERIPQVLSWLERIEASVLKHECANVPNDLDDEIELLRHMGRGVDMLRRMAERP
jgi:hypothetical protein